MVVFLFIFEYFTFIVIFQILELADLRNVKHIYFFKQASLFKKFRASKRYDEGIWKFNLKNGEGGTLERGRGNLFWS